MHRTLQTAMAGPAQTQNSPAGNCQISKSGARRHYFPFAFSHAFPDQVASDPSDWRDLQEQVADIFHKCRFKVEVEKTIESARGKVEVDVLCRGNDSRQAAHYYVRVQTLES